jgi:shikimate kinase
LTALCSRKAVPPYGLQLGCSLTRTFPGADFSFQLSAFNPILPSMTSNIILIGFMGCGKSSIGRRIALRLGYQFFDSDDLIVARAESSISDIFESAGEATFRKWETEVIQSLTGSSQIILATGGGAILNPLNRELFHQLGIVVWLHAEPETLFERASRSRKRPLLEVENPRSTFFQLLDSRLSLYQSTADLCIDATGLSHEQTVERVLQEVMLRKNHRSATGNSDSH